MFKKPVKIGEIYKDVTDWNAVAKAVVLFVIAIIIIANLK